ncbi:MAG: HEAT repeat domain-containing protein [Stenomitos rutilans HA7619-LM2]|nr:HEAT repeat domain-containing protein [Stenomitos rutilans HA7619-LM2]
MGDAAKPYIPDILNLLKDTKQNPSVRGSAAIALGNLGDAAKPYIPDILNLLKDTKQNPSVRGSAAIALGNLGDAAKPYIPDILNVLQDQRQDSNLRGSAAIALGNLGDAAKPYIPNLLNLLQDQRQDSNLRGSVAIALSNLERLNFNNSILVLNLLYGEPFVIGSQVYSSSEWRFYTYFFSGGDEDVKRLLEWVGKPKQLPNQLNHDEGVKTLTVFQKAWDASKDLLALREDLANKIALVAKLGKWQTGDITLLQQHYNNLKAANSPNADSVQAAIATLKVWQWLPSLGTTILTHAAFWLALVFAYPKSPQIQAIFFWNPWVRTILGFGYVTFLLQWVPFLQSKLFEPFKPSLLADAELDYFNRDNYFSESNVRALGVGDEQPIMQVIPEIKGQVILEGDSGLGKTMFLRHLLQQSKRIVVYLPATKCAEGVIEAIQKKLHGDEIKDTKFLQSLIYGGAIDICIDSLNEVNPDTRAKITQFVGSHFKSNILMTTQPLEWLPPSTVKTYVMQPLQSEQIERYLRSRQSALPRAAPVQGIAYEQACRTFLENMLGAQTPLSSEELKTARTILSNPMELTLAAWMLAGGVQPDLFNLREQQYKLMAEEYRRTWNQDFPLKQFSEAVYQQWLVDQKALRADKFYNELLCMEDEKFRMVVSRQWKDAQGEAKKEWYFRHDKIAEFFLLKTFLGKGDAIEERLKTHVSDSRFRGVYFLLATLLPLDAAQRLREDLIQYAADTKDHTVSDTFMQLLRTRTDVQIIEELRETVVATEGALETNKPQIVKIETDKLTKQFCKAVEFKALEDAKLDNNLYIQLVDASSLSLKINISSRFPIIYTFRSEFTQSDVTDIYQKQYQLNSNQNNFFALLISFNNADKLRQYVHKSAYANDFVVIDRAQFFDIQTASSPIDYLKECILKQVDLIAISPYQYGGPVSSNMFFGRDEERKTIIQNISRHSYVLIANRKVGKTSLIRKVVQALNKQEGYRVFDFDLQNVYSYEDFYEVLTEIFPEFSIEVSQPDSFSALSFQKIARTIKQQLPQQKIIFSFDEVDELLAYDLEHNKEQLFKSFRSLSQRNADIKFIFSGTTTLVKQMSNPDSPFFNFCTELRLGLLERKPARDLVIEPMGGMNIEFEDEEVISEEILSITSQHPSIIQYVCDRLIRRVNEKQERRITREDLDTIITSDEFFTYFEKTMWSQSKSIEKLIIYVMLPYPEFTDSDVMEEFKKRDLPAKGVQISLKTLLAYSILKMVNNKYSLNFREFAKLIEQQRDIPTLISECVKETRR